MALTGKKSVSASPDHRSTTYPPLGMLLEAIRLETTGPDVETSDMSPYIRILPGVVLSMRLGTTWEPV